MENPTMQKIFNFVLLLTFIFSITVAGFFALVNINLHQEVVNKLIDHQDFEQYIVVNEDIDDLKYSNYLIHVNKGNTMPPPFDYSDQDKDWLYQYFIDIQVNEKFKDLKKEKKDELLKELSQYLQKGTVGVGFLHKGYYQQLELYYNNPDFKDGGQESLYKRHSIDVYEPSNINISP